MNGIAHITLFCFQGLKNNWFEVGIPILVTPHFGSKIQESCKNKNYRFAWKQKPAVCNSFFSKLNIESEHITTADRTKIILVL